mmetsp:Transcript_38833/g.120034  ORF Transcript_38833/g.120034 Transcript_38833/m.120034 type:complete len:217 (-) Transcript_38833:150-800(-)
MRGGPGAATCDSEGSRVTATHGRCALSTPSAFGRAACEATHCLLSRAHVQFTVTNETQKQKVMSPGRLRSVGATCRVRWGTRDWLQQNTAGGAVAPSNEVCWCGDERAVRARCTEDRVRRGETRNAFDTYPTQRRVRCEEKGDTSKQQKCGVGNDGIRFTLQLHAGSVVSPGCHWSSPEIVESLRRHHAMYAAEQEKRKCGGAQGSSVEGCDCNTM